MFKAICKLKSLSPYSQGKAFIESKEKDETHEDFEKRMWRNRMHYDENGEVFIPPMAFKKSLEEAAKYKSKQIPGKGKATYTKHFEAGVLCQEPVFIGHHKDKVEGIWRHLPANGEPGGGKRVWKCMPEIPKWEGTVEFWVLDELIKKDVFVETLDDAGRFIGIGVFRPRNRGYFGRFAVESVEWVKE